MKKYAAVIVLLLLCLVFVKPLAAQESDFRKHIDFLTSDELKGRLAGTSHEDSLIVKYIRYTLVSSGYQPLYGEGLQRFPIIKRRADKTASDTAWSYNVAMVLPGSDVALKNQYVVLGAHYDHLGMGGRGSGSRRPDTTAIHYGADDNASGVAMLLETAKKLAADRPKRTVVIAAFGAEEQGIVGSNYFVRHLPAGMGKPVLMINYDMVGRLNEKKTLEINGTGTFAEAGKVLQSAPNPDSLHFTMIPGGYGPSDHTAFYTDTIPVLFYTTGVHYDYHTPGDATAKINYEGMKWIYDYTTAVAETLLNAPEKPDYRKAGNEQSSKPTAFKVTLGIIPDFNNVYEGDGMRADVITAGKPADKAGMKNGDIILQIDEMPVHNIEDYMKCLSNLKTGETVKVKIKRGAKEKILDVKL